MWKAVMYKELRETAGIAALGLLVYLYEVLGLMGLSASPFSGGRRYYVPFLGSEFSSVFVYVSALLTIAVALRQTIGESMRGTWLFLFHRPVQRWKLMSLKLITGAGLYLACGLVPILLYAWWAATPGTHASPFAWSMTLSAWRIWLSMTPVYLGAFLTGLRPARWFGSRLLPLAAAALLAGVIQTLPCWWLLGILAVILLDAWLIATILFVAEARDY